MSKDDSAPAFPYVSEQFPYSGMSLRDYFAAAALQGILSHYVAFNSPDKAAEWAYTQAEAMLAERKK